MIKLHVLRAFFIAVAFVTFTAPLMLVQLAFIAVNSRYMVTFPHWYHKQVCRLMGIRVLISGDINPKQPTLFVSNHTSWVDITVLSSVLPVSFVAKKEVASWPFFGWLAKLQRTVFVDRERRSASIDATSAIGARLLEGDRVVLFAEGTSNDGNKILPFKTALFSAIKISDDDRSRQKQPIKLQTITIAYTKRHGLPLGRHGRPIIAWYGDMDLVQHMWNVFKQGPYDVNVHVSAPLENSEWQDRKILAKISHQNVSEQLSQLLYQRS